MKTLQEKIEVMQAAKAGLPVEAKTKQVVSTEAFCWFEKVSSDILWNWQAFDYRIKQHQYKVGDFVEIVKSHMPDRAGTVVEITEIDYRGDYWHKKWLILDLNDHNTTEIKPAEKPEPKYDQFTAETFPKGEVWIRKIIVDQDQAMVVYVSPDRVSSRSHNYSYDKLLEQCEMSLDGRETWRVAGVLNNDS